MTRLTIAGLVLALAAGAAAALPPLKDDTRVRQEFFAGAVGDEIRKNCPTISARMIRVLAKAKELENYAIGLGYSQDDIRKLREDKTAKAELRAMRDAYLAKNGVTPGDAESYCRLGREEIAKNTLTGWLLREN